MEDHTDLIIKYFPGISEKQLDQFGRLTALYSMWNNRVNLISRKDFLFLQERHILHSLAIAKFIQFHPGSYIMDAGTGGGFPGIPLSIFFPDSRFMLVDSIGKKTRAVRDIAGELKLVNVEVMQERVEKIKEQFDYVVSRAVTGLSTFYAWTKNRIKAAQRNKRSNGIIYLKGGDLTAELKELNQYAEIYDISTYFREPFFSSKKLVFIPYME
jgi:16S rRNA (guanine527-N7)-methyltransferase